MFNFIEKHVKITIFIACLVILVLAIILVLVNSKNSSVVTTNTVNSNLNTDGLIIDSTNQFLLNDNIPNEDKYLMLLGQSMTENYGTYEEGNLKPLWDLQNQSTDSFNQTVQQIINSTSKTKNVVTIVDPTSIIVSSDNNKSTVTMNATMENKATQEIVNITSIVYLLKQGDYWLVDNIIFQNL